MQMLELRRHQQVCGLRVVVIVPEASRQ
uniref:Uncharacterized protein n=1 Tax=Rhizophora mucronata TaxID=61149 RepID=A0A2P2PZU5_RHIMU